MTRGKGFTPRALTLLILLPFNCVALIFFIYPLALWAADETLYLKYNIHGQEHRGGFHASYANWTLPRTGHYIIPVNTQVKIDPHYSGRRMLITEINSKRETVFEYNAKYMGMSEEEYVKLITSPQPVSLDGFSTLDKKGIEAGKAYTGMSKKGIMTALGYPATYLTISIEGNLWTYCTHRFGRLFVEFDGAGLVKDVRLKKDSEPKIQLHPDEKI